jgi:hypothetical protein
MIKRHRIYRNCVIPFLEQHLRVEGFPFDNHYQLPNYVFDRCSMSDSGIPPKQIKELNVILVEPIHLVCASGWFAHDISESDALIYWRGAKHLSNGYVRTLILLLTEYDRYEVVKRYLERNTSMKSGPNGEATPFAIRGHLSALLEGRGGSSFVATLMIVDTYPDPTSTYQGKLTFDLQGNFRFQKVQNMLLSLDQRESSLYLATDEETETLRDIVSQWESKRIYYNAQVHMLGKTGYKRTQTLLEFAHMDLMVTSVAPLISARLCARANPMPASFPESFNWSTTDLLEASKDAEVNASIRDFVTRFASKQLNNERMLIRTSGLDEYTLPRIEESNLEWTLVARPADLLLKGDIPAPTMTVS